AQDTFQASAALCGICHDVSNPFHTRDQERIFLPPHAYAPLERTYSEWLMSSFSSEGPSATCQGCHMGSVSGFAASIPSAPERNDVRAHDLTGGNTFVPLILAEFWPGLDSSLLRRGADRAAETLRRAAMLSGDAARDSGGVTARFRITNLTGHKLPTGYPEGRRMWLSVTATDSLGDTVYRSGVYDEAAAALIPDPSAAVYEAVHGLTDSMAGVYGLAAGPTFLFSLNDTVLSDNRIPPRGFTNAGFSERLAAPVGAAYPDGAYWDDVEYPLPAATARVTATLWYQTMSREYATFLRDENAGNPFDWNSWGEKLYDAWEKHGKSAPAPVDSLTIAVADTVASVAAGDTPVPSGYRLDLPFPNPFNAAVSFRFFLPRSGWVRIAVYDAAGRPVATLVDGRYEPGEHDIKFSAPALSSGVYLVRLEAGPFFESRKILLIR
ncbi:MAG TPA: T9SS type A sorting domain-containing protein, partial [Bacteroidota bacterium]|nr:T9SS type A sorting domain-containing protein [Bacteroidota bacterium]